MSDSKNTDQQLQPIMVDRFLMKKAGIANLDESDVRCLQYAFDVCIRSHLGTGEEIGENVIYQDIDWNTP